MAKRRQWSSFMVEKVKYFLTLNESTVKYIGEKKLYPMINKRGKKGHKQMFN